MRKYKYYLKKPKSEIAKDILLLLAVTGMVLVAATSPYFSVNLMRELKRRSNKWRYKPKKVYDTFYNLSRRGYINIDKRGHNVRISLTEKGRKIAGRFQIDSLEIKRPKKWDRKWRIVIFDVPQIKKLYRNAFRGKLKDLRFYALQKSVWVCPYECRAEVELLRDFFGLTSKEVRLITAEHIEDENLLREYFNL